MVKRRLTRRRPVPDPQKNLCQARLCQANLNLSQAQHWPDRFRAWEAEFGGMIGMGLFRVAAAALVIGGVVYYGERGTTPDGPAVLATARTVSDSATAAVRLCQQQPALCSTAATAGIGIAQERLTSHVEPLPSRPPPPQAAKSRASKSPPDKPHPPKPRITRPVDEDD